MNYDKGSQRQRKSDCESFFIYNLLITTLKYNSFIYKKLINTINHTCAISNLLKKATTLPCNSFFRINNYIDK